MKLPKLKSTKRLKILHQHNVVFRSLKRKESAKKKRRDASNRCYKKRKSVILMNLKMKQGKGCI